MSVVTVRIILKTSIVCKLPLSRVIICTLENLNVASKWDGIESGNIQNCCFHQFALHNIYHHMFSPWKGFGLFVCFLPMQK